VGHVEDRTRAQLLAHLRSIAGAGEGSLLEATEGEIRAAAETAAFDLAPLGGGDEPSPAAAATADFSFEPIPEDELADPVESAVLGVEAVRRGEMPPPRQLLEVAAIVLRTERPVLTVADSGFDPPDPPWTGLADRLDLLRPRIRAVGRLRAESAPYGHVAGTGFVVGPDLLLTNRHVAKYFVQGIGTADRLELDLAEEASCDLDAELGGVTTRILELDAPALVHPYWDVALLRVRGAPLADVEPLVLASERLEPGELVGRAVAVVGYPIEQYLPTQELRDLRARLFGSVYGVKRLMPGRLMDRHRTTASSPAGGEREVAAVGHDASTLAGNSGSAVIDVETGTTLGVHVKGLALDANFAVPAWELARDPRLHDLGITFAAGAPEPADPEVEAAWAR
jgi:endonuclease G